MALKSGRKTEIKKLLKGKAVDEVELEIKFTAPSSRKRKAVPQKRKVVKGPTRRSKRR